MRRWISLGRGVLRTLPALLAFAAASAWGGDLDEVVKSGTLRHLGIPYANFVSGAGDGMDADLMKGFAKSLGVKYEFIKEDWGSIFCDLTGRNVKVKGGKIEELGEMPVKGDIAANGITVLPWRQELVNFSSPTFPNQVWLVARADSPLAPVSPGKSIEKDIEAVKAMTKGRSLLGKAGTCLEPSLYGLDNVAGSIKLFEGTLNEIAPALLNGEAELTLLDVPDALVALQKWPGKLKILGPVSAKQDMAVAFPKSSPKLLEAFNAYLEGSRKDGTYGELVKKYYPYVFDYFPEFFESR